jgi:pheromone shutdown-related protein TraB
LLTNFQIRIGDELGVKPGTEMLTAVNLAREKNIPIALVDRDIGISLKRALDQVSFKEKFKLLSTFISGFLANEEMEEDILEKLKDKDLVNELIQELGEEIPSFKRALIDERDRYIAYKIASLPGENIVAVIGAGHVNGIQRILESFPPGPGWSKEEIKDLERIPEKRNFWKYIPYLIPAIFLLIISYGFYTHGFNLTIELLWKWFLINGSLSALGVILALGHPLSALTAFLAAPFTSLNPALAAGWFSGIVELWLRKPKVRDFEALLRLKSISDYWRNGITRILLVIAFANIGSSIATFIALPYLVSLL